MKFLLIAALSTALFAQTSSPDAVVATIDGHKLTVAELQNLLDNSPPQFSQIFHQDPVSALAQVWVLRYLADEAEKLKLAEQSPWKEQLQIQRRDLMANAMNYYERNHYQVPTGQVNQFYEQNKSHFEQVKVRDIKISYKPGLASTGTSLEAIEQAAKDAVNAAHSSTNRPEADALKLANDLVKKLRNGADFTKLAAGYSEDQETKAAGGEFGVIKVTSAYPADLVKAALALKPGDVSEPVKIGNVAFYILQAEQRTYQPINEVTELIIQQIRQEHFNQEIQSLMQRFKPTIENPQLLMQFTSIPSTGPAKK